MKAKALLMITSAAVLAGDAIENDNFVTLRYRRKGSSKFEQRAIPRTAILAYNIGEPGTGTSEVCFTEEIVAFDATGEITDGENGAITVVTDAGAEYHFTDGTKLVIVGEDDAAVEAPAKTRGGKGAKAAEAPEAPAKAGRKAAAVEEAPAKPARGGKKAAAPEPEPEAGNPEIEALIGELDDEALLAVAIGMELTTPRKGKNLDRDALDELFDDQDADEVEAAITEFAPVEEAAAEPDPEPAKPARGGKAAKTAAPAAKAAPAKVAGKDKAAQW